MIKKLLYSRILVIAAITSILVGCAVPQPAGEVLPTPTPTSLPPTSTTEPPTTTMSIPTKTSPPPTATAPEPYIVVIDPDPIVGTWKFSSSDFTRFDLDGTYREARSLESLDDKPFSIGHYDFDNGYLVVETLSVFGVPSCGTKVGKYEVRILDSGKMQIVLIKDSCGPRGGDTKGIYERIP